METALWKSRLMITGVWFQRASSNGNPPENVPPSLQTPTFLSFRSIYDIDIKCYQNPVLFYCPPKKRNQELKDLNLKKKIKNHP